MIFDRRAICKLRAGKGLADDLALELENHKVWGAMHGEQGHVAGTTGGLRCWDQNTATSTPDLGSGQFKISVCSGF